ncbi:hypothetical protein, partial [Staphylococcus aureus]|uniref:hypothetical protein n=1 Tax=Staphylococcus aureus TaxID=1280 RepID=UPI00301C91EF
MHDGKMYMSGFVLSAGRTRCFSEVDVDVNGNITSSDEVTFGNHSAFSNKVYSQSALTKPEFEVGYTGRRWELYHYRIEDGRTVSFIRTLVMHWNDERTTRSLYLQLHHIELEMTGNVIDD